MENPVVVHLRSHANGATVAVMIRYVGIRTNLQLQRLPMARQNKDPAIHTE
jgi:hypothetical protein